VLDLCGFFAKILGLSSFSKCCYHASFSLVMHHNNL